MATISTFGSSLTGSTLESAVMESCQRLQDLERANAEISNNMAVNYFTGDSVVNIAATLPFTQQVDAGTGEIKFVGTDYLNDASWTAGGDVLSTTLAGAVLELLQKLQIAENASAGDANNVNITYDTDTGIATVAAEMPVTFTASGTDGKVEIAAVEYITD